MTEEELDHQNGGIFKKSLEEHFGKLEDYRRQESVKHLLIDILFITICAVICGANNLLLWKVNHFLLLERMV